MREPGTIKWFGGFNPKKKILNDYGYIIRHNKPDLYVNKNHLQCKIKPLVPGTSVTFEVGLNYKNGSEQAVKVKLLENEKDELIIKQCIHSDIKQYFSPALSQFLKYAGEVQIIDLWNNLKNEFKVLLLFKICSEHKDLSLVEKFKEKNKFIRAMLIIVWTKNNGDKKQIAYEKAYKLICEYKQEVTEDEFKIFPLKEKNNYKIDTNKKWSQWTILELLQYCSGIDILDEINEENETIVKLNSLLVTNRR
jgi:cold shock CspA family protein